MEYVHTKGADIPVLGLGTWELRGREARAITEEALRLGYHHIDTAQMYGNESEVGQALASSGIDRDQIFITTKVWWENLRPETFERSVEGSLRQLGLDRVDLLLIHWPHPELPLRSYLDALRRVQAQGHTRFIGVSNFTPKLLEAAADHCPELVTNQVEYHPYLDQTTLLQACRKHDIALTSYAPIARGRVLEDEVIAPIAEKHGKSPVQVTLRWHVQQQGVIAIPKTSRPERLAENMDIFDFELSPDDMQAISGLRRAQDRLVDPVFAPDW